MKTIVIHQTRLSDCVHPSLRPFVRREEQYAELLARQRADFARSARERIEREMSRIADEPQGKS